MARLPKTGDDVAVSAKAAVPLKKLARDDLSIAEYIKTISPEFLSTLDDRSLAILMSSSLERALERFFLEKIRPLSREDTEGLFERDGAPLASFSAKIKIGYAFQIFGKHTRDELNRIRVIRNQFAHAIRPIGFSTPQISSECAKLRSLEKSTRPHFSFYPLEAPWPPIDARLKFLHAVQELTYSFQLDEHRVAGRDTGLVPLD